jgi:hypothetical protein
MKEVRVPWLALILALVASAAATATAKALDPLQATLCLATSLRSSDLVTPPPTPMTSCTRRCLNDSHFLFGVTGSGATCADARSDLTSRLHAAADAGCANRYPPSGMVCLLSQEYPQPCTEVSPGVFQVPGAAIYSCSVLFC